MISGVKTILLLLWVLFTGPAWAQLVRDVERYSTANGLSDNRVTDIIKDKEGFMWFGSWAGISRFDGYNFLIFKSYPGDYSSLRSNRIDQIVEDASGGYLWLKAYDNQIYRFDKRTQQFTALPALLGIKEIVKLDFSKILAVKDNMVWLRLGNTGLCVISNAAADRPSFEILREGGEARIGADQGNFFFFHADAGKNAWLGTSSELVVFRAGVKGSYRINKIRGLQGLEFVKMVPEERGIWLASRKGTLAFASTSGGKAQRWQIADSDINDIFISPETGKAYCTTSKGHLLSFRASKGVQTLMQMPDGSALFSIYEDRLGVLWIESEKYGLIRFNMQQKSFEPLLSEGDFNFRAGIRNVTVFQDLKGTIWMHQRKSGLYSYAASTKKLEKFPLESETGGRDLSEYITKVFYDPAGIFWLGVENEGIEKVIFREQKFQHSTLQPARSAGVENHVRAVFSDSKDRLWVAAKSGRVYIYKDGKEVKLFERDLVVNEGVYSIMEDRQGRLWFGTRANGLIRADPLNTRRDKYALHYYRSGNKKDALSSNSIYSLLEDTKGRIWAGTYGAGIVRIGERNGELSFKTIKNSFKKYPRGNFARVRALAEDSGGRIWVGTTEGLLVFNPNSGNPESYTFKQYRKEPGNIHSLGGDDIQYLYKDSKQQIWVLTSSGGLNKAEGADPLKTLHFVNFSTRQGLPGDYLLSCIEDRQRNLWIATQNGISRFSIDSSTFYNFNQYDGLRNITFSEAASTRRANGELVFGTTSGFVRFNPAGTRPRKVTADLALTGFQVNGDEIEPGPDSPLRFTINHVDAVKLNYDQNTIRLDFAMLDFHSGNNQNYACRLVGLDDTWQSTDGQRRVTYTKLPPGSYMFEVKSLNSQLYEKPPVRKLRITILPPPWKTSWAYVLYILLALALFILVRRIVITVFRLKQRIEVERQLAELKLAFFTQISHELRTPLTLIINPAEKVLENESLSGKGRNHLHVVVKNARRMVSLVNQILDLRKVQTGKATLTLSELEVCSFIRKVVPYFSEAISEKKILLNISCDKEGIPLWLDAEKIEIVLFNLLANSIKFSNEGGKIDVVISDNEQGVSIEVIDEGPGVQNAELDQIFKLYYEGQNKYGMHIKGTGIGLTLAKELVDLHKGSIVARNNVPRGLRVIVELKKGKAHYDTENVQFADQYPVSGIPVFEPPDSIPSTLKLQFGRPSLLLVEDNADLRSFLAAEFSEKYMLNTAINGVEGCKKAMELQPDLILSDVMMPEMDGIAMMRVLKTNEATSHIPVILLTAKSSVESEIEGLRYGADYYITKPFHMELLETAVTSIIQSRKTLFQRLVDKEDLSGSSTEPAAISTQDQTFLSRIIRIVEDRLEDSSFSIDDVAEPMNMSRSSFYKKFKSLTNMAPVEFVREMRLKKAKELFDSGESNVSSVAYAVGFTNPKYFSTCFKAQYCISPREYLAEGKALQKS